MINYLKCAQKLYSGLTEDDIRIENHDGTIIIKEWNESFGVKPTLAELEVAWLDVVKEEKKQEIKEQMYTEINSGISGYTTKYLTNNFKIDSSRFDLDNMKNLMSYAQLLSLSEVSIKGFDNTMHQLTIEELQIVINELIGYGLWLYQHKWEKEYEIDQSTTIEQVNAITFL